MLSAFVTSLPFLFLAVCIVEVRQEVNHRWPTPFLRDFDSLDYDRVVLRPARSLDEDSVGSLPKSTASNDAFWLELSLRYKGRLLQLQLKQDASVFSREHVLEEGGRTVAEPDVSHLYSGRVVGEAGSAVYGSVIDGVFDGDIYTRDGVFHVERVSKYAAVVLPPSAHSIVYSDNDIRFDRIRLKRSSSSSLGDGPCGLQNEAVLNWMRSVQRSAVDEAQVDTYSPPVEAAGPQRPSGSDRTVDKETYSAGDEVEEQISWSCSSEEALDKDELVDEESLSSPDTSETVLEGEKHSVDDQEWAWSSGLRFEENMDKQKMTVFSSSSVSDPKRTKDNRAEGDVSGVSGGHSVYDSSIRRFLHGTSNPSRPDSGASLNKENLAGADESASSSRFRSEAPGENKKHSVSDEKLVSSSSSDVTELEDKRKLTSSSINVFDSAMTSRKQPSSADESRRDKKTYLKYAEHFRQSFKAIHGVDGGHGVQSSAVDQELYSVSSLGYDVPDDIVGREKSSAVVEEVASFFTYSLGKLSGDEEQPVIDDEGEKTSLTFVSGRTRNRNERSFPEGQVTRASVVKEVASSVKLTASSSSSSSSETAVSGDVRFRGEEESASLSILEEKLNREKRSFPYAKSLSSSTSSMTHGQRKIMDSERRASSSRSYIPNEIVEDHSDETNRSFLRRTEAGQSAGITHGFGAAGDHGQQQDVRTCTVYLQADQKLWEHVFLNEGKKSYERTRNEILAMFHSHIKAVNSIFEATDFNGIRGINFVVQRTTIFDNRSCPSSSQDPEYGNPFCEDGTDVSHFLNVQSRRDHSDFCLSYVFTYRDFVGGTLGLAWVASADASISGGICEPYRSYSEGSRKVKRSLNTGIVTLVNYNSRVLPRISQLTLAHEFGHSFGSLHDFPAHCQPGLPDGNFLMFASATSGDRVNNARFSRCSVNNISDVLHSLFSQNQGPITRGGHSGDVPRFSTAGALKKRCCFIQRETSFCGNAIVEDGEECDCGFNDEECTRRGDSCCYPRLHSGEARGCTRTQWAQCSPSEGVCCDGGTCRFVPANSSVCRDSSECSHPQMCDGQRSQCPPSRPRSDGTLCLENSRVCDAGACTRSVCTLLNMEECFLIKGGPTEQCVLACRLRNISDAPCVPSYALPELSPYYFNSSSAEVTTALPFSRGILLRPGSPCNNFQGYCDVMRRCRSVDPNGPLARLQRLLFEDGTFRVLANWIRNNWWSLVVVIALLLACMTLFIKCCSVHTPSTTLCRHSHSRTVCDCALNSGLSTLAWRRRSTDAGHFRHHRGRVVYCHHAPHSSATASDVSGPFPPDGGVVQPPFVILRGKRGHRR